MLPLNWRTNSRMNLLWRNSSGRVGRPGGLTNFLNLKSIT